MPQLNVRINRLRGTTPQDPADLKARVIEKLKQIYDPELPVNIFDLGLIYDVEASADGNVEIMMTLTTPGCPVAQTFPGMIEQRICDEVDGVSDARVELVWDPPWSPEVLSDEVKLDLGLL